MIGFSHPLRYPPLHMRSFHSFIHYHYSIIFAGKIALILREDASGLSELRILLSRIFRRDRIKSMNAEFGAQKDFCEILQPHLQKL